MATWTSPGNFPLHHLSSPSLPGHMSIMPQEKGQEQEGENLEDPQGSSKQKNFWCFTVKTSNRNTAFAVSWVLSPSTFHHPVTGSSWTAFPAEQKERPQARCLGWGKTTAVKQGHD